jgi:ABC-type branched-subunit amino acid transport system ATPase component/ABC-type branched-subunit amino acid transport system permease subunit
VSADLALAPFGFEFPASAIVLGMITGLTYGLLSVGLVIVYRTNRVINFAHGEIGAFGAAIFGLLASKAHVPYYVGLPLAIAAGGGTAALAEVAVIRRLRRAPKLMSVVATLGVAQFLTVFAVTVNSQAGGSLAIPSPPGLPSWNVGALRVTPSYTGILFIAPVLVVGLALFLRRSRFGLALRSAASNPEAARMSGVFAGRMSSLAWAIAGGLSTFTAVLVLPTTGLATGASFGPGLLLRALVGAAIARMSNIPLALGGGMALGVTEGLLLWNSPRGGLVELVLFGIILVAVLIQTRDGTREDERGSAWAAVTPWRPLPEAIARLREVRALAPSLGLVALAIAVFLPLLVSQSTSVKFTTIVAISIVALSVGIVTGLGGLLTLGQFAFGAVGAVVSVVVAQRTGGNVVLSIVYGGLVAAVVSVVIGIPALRIKGLFLTVTTLAFAIVVPAWFLQQSWALGDSFVTTRPVIFGRSLETARSYYYFVLVVFVVMFLVAWNIRRSGFGRLLVSIRDNEDNARAFTVPARRIKLQGFLLGGFIAGVGGAVYAHAFSAIQPSTFLTKYSIDAVVMTVIGGIALLSGPLLGALFVLGVPAFLPLDTAGLAATRFGLLIVILYAPGGIAQMLRPVREWVISRLAVRRGLTIALDEPPEEALRTRSIAIPAADRVQAESTRASIEAVDITKRYGGLTALDEVSIEARPGEILGIIGPNGAGKTTLFEILAGFTQADEGRVLFAGHNITWRSPEERGRLGLIRSFQDAALFPTMTVLETVQLALHRTMPTNFIGSVVGLRGTDKRREATARELLRSIGLWDYRNKQVQELSTGTRRITELACMVALQPTVLLLDEPSSGIAQRETEALGSLLSDLKEMLDLTLVIIEHDIPLIMGLADRVVAMDAGRVIASGTPAKVRNDAKVIEAYLGGKLEAIERSGAASTRKRKTPARKAAKR